MKRYIKIALFIAIIILAIWGYRYLEYREKSLQQVLRVNPDRVTRLIFLNSSSEILSITDGDHIDDIVTYLDQFRYRRKPEDAIDVPKRGVNIHLYDEDDKFDIIFAFDMEAMISLKAYTVINGPIDLDTLCHFKSNAQ